MPREIQNVGAFLFLDYTSSLVLLMYSQFHKTLPKSSLQMHRISVRFYEMGDIREDTQKIIVLVVEPLRSG